MESYNQFASVYDLFMEDTPYENWFSYIEASLNKYNLSPKSVCELGCGTGQMTSLFAKKGLEVIGIDLSAEMLMMAQDHAFEDELEILYLLQDMASFELGEPVDFICSCCDSMNYLLEEEELLQSFLRVKRFLKPSGLFIFDMNTQYKYKEVLGNQIFADQTEEAAYIWTNYYDEEEEINEYEVSFFIQDEDGKYDRSIENHYQRAYSMEQVKALLEKAGLEVLEVNDNYSNKPLVELSERATFIVRNNG